MTDHVAVARQTRGKGTRGKKELRKLRAAQQAAQASQRHNRRTNRGSALVDNMTRRQAREQKHRSLLA